MISGANLYDGAPSLFISGIVTGWAITDWP